MQLTAATAAECEAFGDHMVGLLIGEFDERLREEMGPLARAQRPELVAACLQDGSSQEVACVLECERLSEVDFCRAGASQALPPDRSSAGLPGAARGEVDAATCEAFADHVAELTAAAIIEDAGAVSDEPAVRARAESASAQVREDLRSICLEIGTRDEVDCVLQAERLADVDECGW